MARIGLIYALIRRVLGRCACGTNVAIPPEGAPDAAAVIDGVAAVFVSAQDTGAIRSYVLAYYQL